MEKINLINVTKTYDGRNNVLNDLNITFGKGKMYAIMGPSGCGKTTLLNIMAGLEPLDKGKVMMDDISVTELGSDGRADFRKEHIGFVFQSFYLNPYISVIENVMIPMLVNKKILRSDRKMIAEEKLKAFGMENYRNKKISELSGGEEQRVAIARAMANDPDIILADEPTGNLDDENEKIVFSHLKKLADDGKIVIVVSHNEAVKEYADEIIILNKNTLKEVIKEN